MSLENLLTLIKNPGQEQTWGWANNPTYLDPIEAADKDLQATILADTFAQSFFANIDLKKDLSPAEYERLCGNVVTDVSPKLERLCSEVQTMRGQQAVKEKEKEKLRKTMAACGGSNPSS